MFPKLAVQAVSKYFFPFIINFSKSQSVPEKNICLSKFFSFINPNLENIEITCSFGKDELHFATDFYLEIINYKSRNNRYSSYSGNQNASWISRNMIYSGGVVLLFLVLHFIDFWIPEINYKYVEAFPDDPTRYHEELVHKFVNPIRVGLYSISFIFLSLHLLHGFSSSFKTIGVDSKYYNPIQKFTFIFSTLIPAGFIFIAIFHYLTG